MENKDRFKQDLRLFEVETFSYCNRACWFCPNSFIDRRGTNKVMDRDVYIGLMNQLSEIDFSNEITFSRYNEPLSQKEIILDRIALAREIVPNSVLRINTNGDYVNRDYIFELRDAGLNQLWIQQYLANKEQYNHEKVHKAMLIKLDKLGFEYECITNIEDCKIEYNIIIEGMTVHLRARNFAKDGSDRGGVLDVAKDYVRTQPCKQVFHNMYIDYNGKITVCCNLRSDVEEHKSGIMGDIEQGKLWDIYYSDVYKVWRDAHMDDKPKTGLCKGCRIDVKPSYE